MNLFKTILRVRPQSFWALLKLCMPNILLLWPTYKATKDCMKLSTEHFGRKHYQNGRGNAFRHALWNVLIAKYCHPVAASLERAVEWTKKITDWHEEAFFGKTLPIIITTKWAEASFKEIQTGLKRHLLNNFYNSPKRLLR